MNVNIGPLSICHTVFFREVNLSLIKMILRFSSEEYASQKLLNIKNSSCVMFAGDHLTIIYSYENFVKEIFVSNKNK